MNRLKRRAEFLAAAAGRRRAAGTLVLQMTCRGEADRTGPARFGFTVTRKVGNAVVRNRVRRRLRAAVDLLQAGRARPGTDYVLIGRRETLTAPFERIVAELGAAMERLHRACDEGEPVPPAGARRGRSGGRAARSGARPA